MPNFSYKIITIIFLLMITGYLEGNYRRHFLTHGPSVVAYGRGETTGYDGFGDITFAFYNPASSSLVRRPSLALSSHILFDGSLYNYIGLSQPLSEDIMFGLSGLNLHTGSIELRNSIDDSSRIINTDQWFLSTNISKYFNFLDLYAGLNLNYIYNNFSIVSGGNISLDLGLSRVFNGPILFEGKSQLYLGLSGQSIIQPQIKLTNFGETYSRNFRLTLGITNPVFYRYNRNKQLFYYDRVGLFTDAILDTDQNDIQLRYGAEYCLINRYFIRGGFGSSPTFGLGYKAGDIQLDYAVELKNYTQFHRLNFAFYWGEVPEEEDEDFRAYMEIYNRVKRLYDMEVNLSRQAIERKDYETAINKLRRAVYLLPDNNITARDLLKQAQDLSVATRLDSSRQKVYESYIARDYINAWRQALETLNISISDEDTIKLVEKIYNEATTNNFGQIAMMKQKAVDDLVTSARTAIEATNFELAEEQIALLKCLSGEDYTYFELTRTLKETRQNYTNKCILKAKELSDGRRYSEAMISLYNAQKAEETNQSIKAEREKIMSKFLAQKHFGTKDRMYCDRLYWLAAEYYVKDDLDTSRQTIFALISFNPAYELSYPLLDEISKKEKPAARIEISETDVEKLSKEYEEVKRQNAAKEYLMRAKLLVVQNNLVRAYENYLNAYDLDWTNEEAIAGLKDIYQKVQPKPRPKGEPPKPGEWQEMMGDVLSRTGRKGLEAGEQDRTFSDIQEIIQDYVRKTKSAVESARSKNDLLTLENNIQKLKLFLNENELKRLRKF